MASRWRRSRRTLRGEAGGPHAPSDPEPEPEDDEAERDHHDAGAGGELDAEHLADVVGAVGDGERQPGDEDEERALDQAAEEEVTDPDRDQVQPVGADEGAHARPVLHVRAPETGDRPPRTASYRSSSPAAVSFQDGGATARRARGPATASLMAAAKASTPTSTGRRCWGSHPVIERISRCDGRSVPPARRQRRSRPAVRCRRTPPWTARRPRADRRSTAASSSSPTACRGRSRRPRGRRRGTAHGVPAPSVLAPTIRQSCPWPASMAARRARSGRLLPTRAPTTTTSPPWSARRTGRRDDVGTGPRHDRPGAGADEPGAEGSLGLGDVGDGVEAVAHRPQLQRPSSAPGAGERRARAGRGSAHFGGRRGRQRASWWRTVGARARPRGSRGAPGTGA